MLLGLGRDTDSDSQEEEDTCLVYWKTNSILSPSKTATLRPPSSVRTPSKPTAVPITSKRDTTTAALPSPSTSALGESRASRFVKRNRRAGSRSAEGGSGSTGSNVTVERLDEETLKTLGVLAARFSSVGSAAASARSITTMGSLQRRGTRSAGSGSVGSNMSGGKGKEREVNPGPGINSDNSRSKSLPSLASSRRSPTARISTSLYPSNNTLLQNPSTKPFPASVSKIPLPPSRPAVSPINPGNSNTLRTSKPSKRLPPAPVTSLKRPLELSTSSPPALPLGDTDSRVPLDKPKHTSNTVQAATTNGKDGEATIPSKVEEDYDSYFDDDSFESALLSQLDTLSGSNPLPPPPLFLTSLPPIHKSPTLPPPPKPKPLPPSPIAKSSKPPLVSSASLQRAPIRSDRAGTAIVDPCAVVMKGEKREGGGPGGVGASQSGRGKSREEMERIVKREMEELELLGDVGWSDDEI